MIRALPLLLLALPLAACTSSDGAGPPLGVRAVEGLDLNEPKREADPPPPAETALRSQLDTLRAKALGGQIAFDAALPRAQAAAGRGGAEGSEPWIAAQQALSTLEAARQPTTAALAELDRLLADRLMAGQDEGAAEIQALQAELGTIADTQQQAIDGVRARISR